MRVWNGVMEETVKKAIHEELEHLEIDLEILLVENAEITSKHDLEANENRKTAKNEDFLHLNEKRLLSFDSSHTGNGMMKIRLVIFLTESLVWKRLSCIFRPQPWSQKPNSDPLKTNTSTIEIGFDERKGMENLPPTNTL